jgi:hypothetical protein
MVVEGEKCGNTSKSTENQLDIALTGSPASEIAETEIIHPKRSPDR